MISFKPQRFNPHGFLRIAGKSDHLFSVLSGKHLHVTKQQKKYPSGAFHALKNNLFNQLVFNGKFFRLYCMVIAPPVIFKRGDDFLYTKWQRFRCCDMEFNQYDTELQNVVMEAFGHKTMLTRMQLLELFDHDEAFAIPVVRALIAQQRISAVGLSDGNRLPEAITNILPKRQKNELLWLERGAWFLAGILITLLLGWLVMRLGHHHHIAH